MGVIDLKSNTFPRYPVSRPRAVPFVFSGEFSDKPSDECITPNMIKRAYGFGNAGLCASGVKIALIEAFRNDKLKEDAEVFSSYFGLNPPKLSAVYPDGTASRTNPLWAKEAALDSQWVHALAPDAEITAVFSRSDGFDDLFSCIKYAVEIVGADVVCMSFGAPEFLSQGEISRYFADSRCVFVAAAGDEGGRVFFPASSGAVLSVGGSSLRLSENGARLSAERAWEYGGGGSSRYEGIPAFQSVFGTIERESGGFRAIPDAAFLADRSPGVCIYVSDIGDGTRGGWTNAGGTSFSAAAWSAVCAGIIKRRPPSLDKNKLCAYLYALAGGTEYNEPQYYFYDVVVGSNTRYRAHAGWDFCTGLGTPVVKQLLDG